jgi:hypothetical protein
MQVKLSKLSFLGICKFDNSVPRCVIEEIAFSHDISYDKMSLDDPQYVKVLIETIIDTEDQIPTISTPFNRENYADMAVYINSNETWTVQTLEQSFYFNQLFTQQDKHYNLLEHIILKDRNTEFGYPTKKHPTSIIPTICLKMCLYYNIDTNFNTTFDDMIIQLSNKYWSIQTPSKYSQILNNISDLFHNKHKLEDIDHKQLHTWFLQSINNLPYKILCHTLQSQNNINNPIYQQNKPYKNNSKLLESLQSSESGPEISLNSKDETIIFKVPSKRIRATHKTKKIKDDSIKHFPVFNKKNEHFNEQNEDVSQQIQDFTKQNEDVTEQKEDVSEKKEDVSEKKEDVSEKKEDVSEKKEDVTEKKEKISTDSDIDNIEYVIDDENVENDESKVVSITKCIRKGLPLEKIPDKEGLEFLKKSSKSMDKVMIRRIDYNMLDHSASKIEDMYPTQHAKTSFIPKNNSDILVQAAMIFSIDLSECDNIIKEWKLICEDPFNYRPIDYKLQERFDTDQYRVNGLFIDECFNSFYPERIYNANNNQIF